ncbi:MAG: hypothetical protein EP330_01510 [Deltaproteobacteria bacterium]|nr:MAG: hypothetical protein EP330_01510 [Deltaproteobacteria bacterium]
MARRAPRVATLTLVLAACGAPAAPGEAPELARTVWDEQADALDLQIESAQAFADASPQDWTRRESLVLLRLERAHLQGSLDDYEAAELALDKAFRVAPEGSGPVLAAAEVDLALHRFTLARERAESLLARPLLSDRDAARIRHVRVLASAELGDTELAVTLATEGTTEDPTPQSWADLALAARAAGDAKTWAAAIDQADALCACPQTRFAAWTAWQRGLADLDADRPSEALAHFRIADAHHPGDWVIEEHLAETLVLTGSPEEAVAIYEAILAERDAPVVWWGLAKAREAMRMPAASAHLRAAQGFDAQLARYPDAMAGHALAFFAEQGPVSRAVELARRDAALRPTADNLTRLADLESLL